MADFPLIGLAEAITSLGRRPGILIGPGATCLPGTMLSILLRAIRLAGDDTALTNSVSEESYRSLLDTVASRYPDKFPLVSREIQDGMRSLKPSLDLPHLAKAGWSVCISLADDLLFESALRNYLDAIATSRTVTVIDSVRVEPPERTTPVYKLLGNINNSDRESALALSESALLVRQQIWPALLRTCPDYLREGALFVFGTAGVIPLLRVALSTLSSMHKPTIARLLFLKDDPTLNDATIQALCRQFRTVLVDASLRDFCSAISEYKPRPRLSLIQSLAEAGTTPLGRVLAAHEALVSIPPATKPPAMDIARHRHLLIDGLFRPSSIDWNPYLLNLDLRRTVTDQCTTAIRQLLDAPRRPHARYIMAHGEAGIGKTSVLKRVALEIAQQGVTALWCRRAHTDNWIRHYRKLANDLSELIRIDEKKKEKTKEQYRFAVFCDDPWALRLDAGELMACFENFPAPIVFVFAVRNSAYFTSDIGAQTIGGLPHFEIPIPFELDPNELKGLAAMLHGIGAVKDEAAGQQEVAKVRSRNARDILCSLWYLVPETRSQLEESLRDEYCRLGDVKDSIASVAQAVTVNSSVAHRAYEYVTVTSNLDIGLPVEVLVSALGINYDEWLDMTANGRPLWGLLYDERDQERDTLVYRTRNEVVTRILLDLVNGGVGHIGEVRVLKELLRACNVGSPAYRGFVTDVLVRSRSGLAKYLTYEQGVELYDIARKALPHPDRVIEHHKGIWIDDVGHDFKKAYGQFETALQCSSFPGADRTAPKEHIHTSMAATVVRMVKAGEQDRVTGYELVKEHLRQASSPTFFNAHTAHVAANLLFELAQHGDDTSTAASTDAVSLSSLADALQEIEKGLQLVGAHGRDQPKQERNIAMLSDLQRRILKAIPDAGLLRELAKKKFQESGNQIGFEAVARRLLADAIQSDKGRMYNEVNQYLHECIEMIAGRGAAPSPELRLVRVDLTIRWRIQRPSGPIDWKMLRDDLHEVQSSPRYRDDVIKQFYYAVAQFHCGNMTDANATFSSLRRLSIPALAPAAIRCYYLGEGGNPRRFQGTIEQHYQKFFLYIPELDLSVPARAYNVDGGPGATVHAYLAFAMNGPIAVFDKPADGASLLP